MARLRSDVPIGRSAEYEATLPNPDRTARRFGSPRWDSDLTYREWPNRASMARSIRMQQRRESHSTDWQAVVALRDIEGF